MFTERTDSIGAKVVDDAVRGVPTTYGVKTPEGIVITPKREKKKEATDAKQQVTPVEVPAAPPKPRKRKAVEIPAAVPQPAKEVGATLSFSGFGSIPSVYRHVYVGNGVVVLGLIPGKSFVPSVSGADMVYFAIDADPDRKYAHVGLSFRDDEGDNIILLGGQA